MDSAFSRRTDANPFGRQGPTVTADCAERIAILERALKKNRELLAASQRALSGIYVSREWKVLLRQRWVLAWFLPPHSRRRRVADYFTATAIRWFKKAALVLGKPGQRPAQSDYRRWIRQYEPTASDLEQQRGIRFGYEPRFSIVIDCGEEADHLRALWESLQQQTYSRWELCLAVDERHVGRIEQEFAGNLMPIQIAAVPGHLAATERRNAALRRATGDFVVFLETSDLLAPFAGHAVVRTLQDDPDTDLLYSDEDRIDDAGEQRSAPLFKAGWSPDALRSGNRVGQLAVFRTELVRQCGGFRPEFADAAEYDLVLRVAERARAVVHVPGVLVHRRKNHSCPESPAAAERRALAEHLERLHINASVRGGCQADVHQVFYHHPVRPLVSILIPSHDQQATLARCLESIQRSSYANYELILIENHSQEPALFRYYDEIARQPNIRVLTWDRPFNFAAVNNFAAARANGDVLLFLNNDVQAINPDWLERMLEHALRPEVGAVGAKLYYSDGTVQHGGILLGVCGIVGHAHRHFPKGSPGHGNRLISVHNVTAVTGACLMMRRQVFQEVGGFDERLVMEFNDVDLCLKVREKGYWIVWTPHAELYHWESKTRGGYADTAAKAARFQGELQHFLARWGDVVAAGDPFYNPHLSPDHEDFSLRR